MVPTIVDPDKAFIVIEDDGVGSEAAFTNTLPVPEFCTRTAPAAALKVPPLKEISPVPAARVMLKLPAELTGEVLPLIPPVELSMLISPVPPVPEFETDPLIARPVVPVLSPIVIAPRLLI
jgi:hypothetical protein